MRRNNTDETHKNRFTGLFVVSLTATVQAAVWLIFVACSVKAELLVSIWNSIREPQKQATSI